MAKILSTIFFCWLSALAVYAAEPFTLVILPDTQHYSDVYPNIFNAQVDWIINNRQALNIEFVIHVGDLTEKSTEKQWIVAKNAMHKLDNVVPYSMTLGNHDYESKITRDTPRFNQAFPVATAGATLGGTFEPGKLENSYHIIQIGGTPYLILGLEFGPRDEVVAWANQVITDHPLHKILFFTHAYLDSDETRLTDGDIHNPHDYFIESIGTVNDGEELWQKLVRQHPNMLMVFCGHIIIGDCVARLDSQGLAGNTVVQMLANYQTLENGGNGYLRILTFDPDSKDITVKTYSPYVNQYSTSPQNQFVIENFTNAFMNGAPVVAPLPQILLQEDTSLSLNINYLQDYIHDDSDAFADLTLQFFPTPHNACALNGTILQIQPAANWFGADTITVQVTDKDNLTTIAYLPLFVQPVNDAPEFAALPVFAGDEDESIQADLTAFVSDVDDDPADLSLTATVTFFTPGLAGGDVDDLVYVYEPGEQRLVFTPAANVYGEFGVRLKLCDPAGLCAEEQVVVTVRPVNDKPQLAGLPQVVFAEDSSVVMSPLNWENFVQDDEPITGLSWAIESGSYILASKTGTSFRLTAAPNWFGNESLRVIVTDAGGLADDTLLHVSVTSVNDAPRLVQVPDVTFAEDGQAALDLSPFMNDPDHAVHELRLGARVLDFSPAGQTVRKIAAIGDLHVTFDGATARFTSTTDSCGQFSVELSVCDPLAACGADTIRVTVTPKNDPPVMTEPPVLTWPEDDSLRLDKSFYYSCVSDVENAPSQLNFTLNGSAKITTRRQAGGWLLFAPANYFGRDSLTIIVTDANGAADSARQQVLVTPVNDAPVWQSLPAIYVLENEPLELDLDEYLFDIDNSLDELAVTVTSPDPRVTCRLNAQTHLLTLSVSFQQVDTLDIFFRAVDPAGLVAATTARLYLFPVNNPPNLQALPKMSLNEDAKISFVASLWQAFVSDADHALADLSWEIVATENIAVQRDQKVFTLTPRQNWFGHDSLVVIVADPFGAADSTLLIVEVAPVNDPPTIVNMPDSLVVSATPTTLNLPAHINDLETPFPQLRVDVTSLSPRLSFSFASTTGELVLLASAGEAFATWLRIRIEDTEQAVARDSIRVVYWPTLVQQPQQPVEKLALLPCYPNPFNSLTRITFTLPAREFVHVYALNILGDHVIDLAKGIKKAGEQTVLWNSNGLPSGVYFIVLQTSGERLIQRCLLLN